MIKKFFTIFCVALLAMTSCIREEALNTECDIETCTLPEAIKPVWKWRADDKKSEPYDAVVDTVTQKVETVYPIKFDVQEGVDRTALAPTFTITAGATVEPASGTVRNFTKPQFYRVTSEDRCWSRVYCISVVERKNVPPTPDRFTFDHARMSSNKGVPFTVFYDKDPFTEEDSDFQWSSGNSGFAITGVAKSYKDYPTLQSDYGFEGKCLQLTTRETGSFGAMANMPIAAGNLFLGSFDVSSALTNSLKSTRFGMAWRKVPVRVKGHFKYKSGDTFYELDKTAPGKMKEVPGKRDLFNIVAVFYECSDDMPSLDGTNYMDPSTDAFRKSVCRFGRIDPAQCFETDQWTEFDLKLEPRDGMKIDLEKLIHDKYKFALVFTSSINGDTFSGAPGSTLWIDEVTVEYADMNPKME